MYKDIAGQKFGKLVAIKIDEAKTRACGKTYCLCRCDCGNEVSVYLGNLTSGHTRSCGCLHKENYAKKREDLTGRVFGKLIVIEYSPEESKKRGRTTWKCLCECGNIIYRTAHDLKTGEKDGVIQSCGCYQKELLHTLRFKDLTQQRFGKLVCLNWFRNENGRIWWDCQCDCGNRFATAADRLLRGQTRSCGCARKNSVGEENIVKILQENNIEYIRGKNFPEYRQRYFDFFLPEYNRLIEFDGIQHFKTVEVWEPTDSLSSRQARDKEKNQYTLEHNIELVRIPYWERDKITLDMLLGPQYLIVDKEGNYKNITRQELFTKNG